MDTTEKPKRPWWRSRRMAAMLAVYAVILYPFSSGAISYCSGRGWVSTAAMLRAEIIYTPLMHLDAVVPKKIGGRTAEGWWREWNSELAELGVRHGEADD